MTRALDQPDVAGFVVSLRDVDEEHRATERLRESEREARSLILDLEQEEHFLRILLDASSDGVTIIGPDLNGPLGQSVDRTDHRLDRCRT